MVEQFNSEGTLLALAARTATVNSDPVTIRNGASIRVYIAVTSVTLTPSVVPKIQGQDPLSEQWFDILEGAAITTDTGDVALVVCPTAAAVANEVAAVPAPRIFRLRMEHGDIDSITYSASFEAYVL